MNTQPTPPPGFRLVKGGELKAPFDKQLLYWWIDDGGFGKWFRSSFAGVTSDASYGPVRLSSLDWYATPDISTHTDCPQSLLSEAQKIIEERGKDYGDINQSFERIAKFWSAYKGVEITPHEVADMMILLKISRNVTSRKKDNLLDIVGYAECAAKLNKAE
jgi:hypothetical protein